MTKQQTAKVDVLAPYELSETDFEQAALDEFRKHLPDPVSSDECEFDPRPVLSTLGVQSLVDRPWARVTTAAGASWTVSSRLVISKLRPSGDIEGLYPFVLDKVVVFIVSVAGGQGGGFSVHLKETGQPVFATREFVPDAVLWVEELGRLVVSVKWWKSLKASSGA